MPTILLFGSTTDPIDSLKMPQCLLMERSLDSTLLTKRFVLPSSNLKSFPLSFLSDVTQVGVNDFEFIRVIGKGSFGKVKLVRKKSDGKLYAMKVILLLLHPSLAA